MRILHLSYDYPDTINPNKTEAIKNIIDISRDFDDPYCVSLNRTVSFKNQTVIKEKNSVFIGTFGLPKGIFFRFTLYQSIKQVFSVGLDFKSFHRVHAHKLTFEGPIAYSIYKKYKVPYVITLQQTDFKILKYRPLMKNYYFKILFQADKVVLISPWMKRQLSKAFGSKRVEMLVHKLCNIPLVVERKWVSGTRDNGRFLCVFHMRDSYIKIKNIYRVLKAIKILREAENIIHLDIAGDGPAKAKVEAMVKKLNLNGQVKILGRVPNDSMVEIMSGYRGFILCSYPETFGMVYIEALSAGIPIIYSKNAGIDGFFDELEIGIRVQHDNLKEICSALAEINNAPEKFRERVQALQKSGYLNQFSGKAVREKYSLLYKSEVNP